MDGVHDLGGMHGFGGVQPEADEPAFHAHWEARMFALASAAPFALAFGDDWFRSGIERMEPADYLRSSYYEKWYWTIVANAERCGALLASDLDDKSVRPVAADVLPCPAITAANVVPAIFAGASQARTPTTATPRRFAVGDTVRTRRQFADGHNRMPRYARGKPCRVASVDGVFLVADDNARGVATAETLYTIRFDMGELWGAGATAGDTLCLAAWDR